jgi:2-C-methyl-D-erythritol 4-phosphate cytidylyltransferase
MAVALIVAAGRGQRLGSATPKALVELAGRPMLHWSLDAVRRVSAIRQVVVALPPDVTATMAAELTDVVCVAGGTFRSQSVRAALDATSEPGPVIVHDAARPLAPAALFERVLLELEDSLADAAVAAARVADTIKEVSGDGRTVTRTLDRSRLWAIQTPQAFRRGSLEQVLNEASEDLLARATDDAWLIEQSGGVVRVVDSGGPNFKVTTADDLRLAELLLPERAVGGVAP